VKSAKTLKQSDRTIPYTAFLKHLSPKEVSPVYLFFGDEPFLMERALDKLIELVVDPQLKDLAYSAFDADSTDQKTICSEARTVPFLAARRLVVVRKAHLLQLRSKKAPVALYLQEPCPTTCLVLVAAQTGGSKKSKNRKRTGASEGKLVSLVTQHGVAVSFPAFKKPSEVVTWIQQEVSRLGKTMVPRAAAELQQLSGKNLSEVNNELQKVVAYVGGKNRIELDDVVAAVTDVHHETTYALADALADQDVAKALDIFDNLFRDGEHVLRILWGIHWQLDRLYAARMMVEKEEKPEHVAAKLKIFPSYRRRFFAQVRRFTPERLRELHHEMVSAELRLKSTSVDEKLLLELLIVRMCGVERPTARAAPTG
jgi:DNA polymerase-3 subunit delta